MSDDRQVPNLDVRDDGNALSLSGEVDVQTVSVLETAFAAQNGQPDIRLELAEVTFMDSSGMHAIVAFARSREAIGTVTLTGASPFLLRLFEITRLTSVPNLVIRERA